MQKRERNEISKIRLFGINSAGLKSKLDSFNDILKRINPQIWTIQETKLKPNENLKGDISQKYQIFYLSRNGKQGGGLAIGISKEIESTLMREGNDQVEALVVQIVIDKLPIRVVVAYGPQETELKEKKEEFLRSCH